MLIIYWHDIILTGSSRITEDDFIDLGDLFRLYRTLQESLYTKYRFVSSKIRSFFYHSYSYILNYIIHFVITCSSDLLFVSIFNITYLCFYPLSSLRTETGLLHWDPLSVWKVERNCSTHFTPKNTEIVIY